MDRAIECESIHETVVVSRSDLVLEEARRRGAIALEERTSGLNAALELAAGLAVARRAEAICVIPTDLPLLTVSGLTELLQTGARAGGGLLVPDRRKQGTNFLFLTPPLAGLFRFGPGSFGWHCATLAAANVNCSVVGGSLASFDVDEPGDLHEWERAVGHRNGSWVKLAATAVPLQTN
jgi:2-phospho-L-lactate guanylyltransferase